MFFFLLWLLLLSLQGVDATYFPFHEISWTVKYVLDALLSIPSAHFNHAAIETFPTRVEDNDDRLLNVVRAIQKRMSLEEEESGAGAGAGVLEVLDVGCGKGRFAGALNRNVNLTNRVRLTGTDIAIDMLKIAAKNTPGTFVRSSATSLPFPDESFDVVYMIESLEHVLFVDRTLEECRRVLRNKGVL
jgi:SAM-dependent methyltransferase